MSNLRRLPTLLAALSAVLTMAAPSAQSGLPNPYRPVKGLADGGGPSVPGGEWARLPSGREMGPPASVYVDIDGESIWAFIRCDETNPVPVKAALSMMGQIEETYRLPLVPMTEANRSQLKRTLQSLKLL